MPLPADADAGVVPGPCYGGTVSEISGGWAALYMERLFAGMMEHAEDARQLALDFYGPIFLSVQYL